MFRTLPPKYDRKQSLHSPLASVAACMCCCSRLHWLQNVNGEPVFSIYAAHILNKLQERLRSAPTLSSFKPGPLHLIKLDLGLCNHILHCSVIFFTLLFFPL